MKTLNRTLSLTLVFALVFSLMSFAFAANPTTTSATTGYTDAASIGYKEGVDVTSAIGVFQGNDKGAFAPKDNLTREQAAKVICYLTMGKNAADSLTVSSAPYTDVAADRWSAGSIAYCKRQGIIAGYGNGKFGPTDPVTGYQFAKMLLVALGYDATIENFNGADWNMNVAKRAHQNSLFASNPNFMGSAAATREEAALYAMNLLQKNIVTYANKGGSTTIGGVPINQGASEPSQKDNPTFMATYCSGLVVDNGVKAVDAFGRAMRKWTYRGTVIGMYSAGADLTFTSEAAGSTPTAQTVSMGISNYTVINGGSNGAGIAVMGNVKTTKNVKTAADIAELTANGRVIELYVDEKDPTQINRVVAIDTVLTQISAINTASKAVILTPLDNKVPSLVVNSDNPYYAVLSKMAVKDYVLASPDANNTTAAIVAVPKTVTGALTKVDKYNGKTTALTVGGTSYPAAFNQIDLDKLDYSSINIKRDVTLFLDSYGYAVYITNATAMCQYFIPVATSQSLVDSHIVTTATGYAIDGSQVSLNIGTKSIPKAGELYSFKPADAQYSALNGNAEYEVELVKSAGNGEKPTDGTLAISSKEITRGDFSFVGKKDGDTGTFEVVPFAPNVKFIYIQENGTVTFKDGIQPVTEAKTAQGLYVKNPNGADQVVAAVLVNGAPADAVGADVLYLASYTGSSIANGHMVYSYNAYINGALTPITSTTYIKDFDKDPSANRFCYYSKDATSGIYALSVVADQNAEVANSVMKNATISNIKSGYLLKLAGDTEHDFLNAGNASIVDLGKTNIRSLGELNDAVMNKKLEVKVSFIYGNNKYNANYCVISSIFIHSATSNGVTPPVSTANVWATAIDTEYSVDYYNQTGWTNDKAADAVKADLTSKGWTVTSTDKTVNGYSFDVAKTVNGVLVPKTYTLPSKNVKEIFKVTAELKNAATPATDFSLLSISEIAASTGAVTHGSDIYVYGNGGTVTVKTKNSSIMTTNTTLTGGVSTNMGTLASMTGAYSKNDPAASEKTLSGVLTGSVTKDVVITITVSNT